MIRRVKPVNLSTLSNPQGGAMNITDRMNQLCAIGLGVEQLKIQRRIWAAEARLAKATQEREELAEVTAYLATMNVISPDVEKAEARILQAEGRAERATWEAERNVQIAKDAAQSVATCYPALRDRPIFRKYTGGY